MLYEFMQAGDGEGDYKKNVVRACSEALTYAVAKCFCPHQVFAGFTESFYPRDEDVEGHKKKLSVRSNRIQQLSNIDIKLLHN